MSLQYLLEVCFQEAGVPTAHGHVHMHARCLEVLGQIFSAQEVKDSILNVSGQNFVGFTIILTNYRYD